MRHYPLRSLPVAVLVCFISVFVGAEKKHEAPSSWSARVVGVTDGDSVTVLRDRHEQADERAVYQDIPLAVEAAQHNLKASLRKLNLAREKATRRGLKYLHTWGLMVYAIRDCERATRRYRDALAASKRNGVGLESLQKRKGQTPIQ